MSSSIIEDEFFNKLDNELAPFIKKFQNNLIDKGLLTDDNLGRFPF